MLEALVDGQDHKLAGAAKFSVHQDAGQVTLGPRVVAFVRGENFLHFLADTHRSILPLTEASEYPKGYQSSIGQTSVFPGKPGFLGCSGAW